MTYQYVAIEKIFVHCILSFAASSILLRDVVRCGIATFASRFFNYYYVPPICQLKRGNRRENVRDRCNHVLVHLRCDDMMRTGVSISTVAMKGLYCVLVPSSVMSALSMVPYFSSRN